MASESQRIIVITGASRGLGLEWVRQLSQDTENFVIAVVRNPDKASLLEPFLSSHVVAIQGDLTDIDSFPAVSKKITDMGGGRVDLLINNAGIMEGKGASATSGISTSTVEEWESQFRVNVVGLVFFTIALIPLLKNSSEKRVVNIASFLSDHRFIEARPDVNCSSYSATKAAVTVANAKFHIEFKSEGFIFLALNPGFIITDMTKDLGIPSPLQAEESVSRCLSFVNRSTIHDSGKYWSLDGSPEPLLFGYHIHPNIPTENTTLRVADVGSGTGIWLTDLADKLLKSVRLDALEISFDAIPLPEMLPSNMSLHHWDIKADVPEYLVGVYDIVHIRHFAFVLHEHELKVVVSRLLRLLKSGGYLQWTDVYVNSLRLEKINPEIKADSQIKLMNIFQGDDVRLRQAWVPTLPILFAEGGLVNVTTDKKEAPPYLALALHECGMLATEVLTRSQVGNEELVTMLKETLSKAAKETRDGSYLAFTRYVVIGQKK